MPEAGERSLAGRLVASRGSSGLGPVFILAGLAAVDELDRQAFALLTPTIRRALDIDISGVLTLAAVSGVAMMAAAIPLAQLADRVERRRLAAAGAACWGMFVVLTASAVNLGMLALARLGCGAGRATVMASHDSLIADHAEIGRRPTGYALHRSGTSFAQALGPLLAAGLAVSLSWRSPFVAVAAAVFALALILAFRTEEPLRGHHERRALGLPEEVVATEEGPASLAESLRMLSQVRTLRRLWVGLPLVGVSALAMAPLLQIAYDEVHGQSQVRRGVIAAIAEPGQLLGYVLFVPLAGRLLSREPAKVLRLTGLLSAATATLLLVFAMAPRLGHAVAANFALAVVRAPVGPLLAVVLSLVIPPRSRSLGFAVSALVMSGSLLAAPLVGVAADAWGVRAGVASMALPILVGSYLVATSGVGLGEDVARARSTSGAMSQVRSAHLRGESKLLTVRDLDVSYSGVQVLFGVDLEVAEGEIVALLGTNGAGKSTLLRAISGLVDVESGAVILDGRDMTYAPPNEIVERGVLQVPGGRGIFGSLSVAENMRSASWVYRHDPEHVEWAVREVLRRFPRLRERWNQPASSLSGGEQQMLTLGMAFVAKPRVLMIDELSLGLAPTIVEQLLEMVRAIRDGGTTIIIVEQSVNMALSVAEHAYFMEKGEIRFDGPTAELLDRPDILRSVFLEGTKGLGAAALTSPATVRRPEADGGTAVLDLSGLTKLYGSYAAVSNLDLRLHRGEIIGVIGPNGAGKTTLFDLISGHSAATRGRVCFAGRDVTHLPADARARLGLGRSFQDAWLFPGLSVVETITLACERRRNVELLDPIAAALHLPAVARWERRVAARADEMVDLLGLGAFRDKFVAELSTGSRRLVDLACMVAQQPEVMLFDEPSSGIAQREAEALGPLLREVQQATGAALLVIEHDMSLVAGLADELVALDLGQVIARGRPASVLQDDLVVASYLGASRDALARSGPTLVGSAGSPKH